MCNSRLPCSHGYSFHTFLCPSSDLGFGHLVAADRLLVYMLLREPKHVVQRLGQQRAPRRTEVIETIRRPQSRVEGNPLRPQHRLVGLGQVYCWVAVLALRNRTAAAAARLAQTEQQVARIQDELASRDPRNPEHKRRADEAREAMRRARETEQKYKNS